MRHQGSSRKIALQERINVELASDPAFGALCSNSQQVFDSAIIVPPEWTMVPAHPPTVLTFCAFTLLVGAGAGGFSIARGVSKFDFGSRSLALEPLVLIGCLMPAPAARAPALKRDRCNYTHLSDICDG
jgi:hypothetical protein